MDRKKIIFIAAGIILIVLLIILFFVSKKSTSPNLEITKITKISEKQVLFPTLSADQTKILYFSNENEAALYSYDLSTQKTEKMSDKLDTPDNIIWSPLKDKAIFQATYDKAPFENYGSVFADPSIPDQAVTFWIYDLAIKKLNRLNLNVKNVIWTNDGRKIVYTYYDAEKFRNVVNISDADGKNYQQLTDLDFSVKKVLSYEQNSLIFGTTFSSEETDSKLTIYKLETPTKATLLEEGVEPNFITVSPDAKKITSLNSNNLLLIDVASAKTIQVNSDISKPNIIWLSDNKSFYEIIFDNNAKSNSLYLINSEDNVIKLAKTIENLPSDIDNLLLASNDKTLYFTSENKLFEVNIL